MVLLGLLVAVVLGAVVLGGIASGVGARGDLAERRGPVGARRRPRHARRLSARVRAAGDRGRRNPRHLERADYLALGEQAARATAARNGVRDADVAFPGGGSSRRSASASPSTTRSPWRRPPAASTPPRPRPSSRRREATGRGGAGAGEYRGPFAYRQGRPMRPTSRSAFDRMAQGRPRRRRRADHHLRLPHGRRAGAALRRAPRPEVGRAARPSLHRLGTELDLAPPAAYAWLAAQRRALPLHPALRMGAVALRLHTERGLVVAGLGDAGRRRAARRCPSFVPARFAPAIARAAQRWNVSAALLAAQLYAGSNFNPFARSPPGAQGIAQFMPGTARALRAADPFDAERAIDAQAHLMRDLLRRFGSVPLALAAYNAGPARSRACGCVPPIPETQATWRRSSACSTAPATRRATARARSRCDWSASARGGGAPPRPGIAPYDGAAISMRSAATVAVVLCLAAAAAVAGATSQQQAAAPGPILTPLGVGHAEGRHDARRGAAGVRAPDRRGGGGLLRVPLRPCPQPARLAHAAARPHREGRRQPRLPRARARRHPPRRHRSRRPRLLRHEGRRDASTPTSTAGATSRSAGAAVATPSAGSASRRTRRAR